MRVALVGFHHETNSFCSEKTTYADFLGKNIWRGEEIREAYESSHSTAAGFFQAAREEGFELVPLILANARPSGVIEKQAVDQILSEMSEALRAGGPWDGVLLAQHGAAVSDSELDVDGLFLGCTRKIVGSETPIGVVYDMHANISPQMIDSATVAIVYRTNPHLDARERGLDCGRLLARAIRGDVRPTTAFVQVPLVVGITQQETKVEPMRGLVTELERIERLPGVLSASISMGYAYADVEEMGASCLVITDGQSDLAKRLADMLANNIWNCRHEMISDAMAPEAAVRLAKDALSGPVGILDVGDNMGGGSPGDSTILLKLALEMGATHLLVSILDPQAAQDCAAAGVGAEIALAIGGKRDAMLLGALPVRGIVRRIDEGKYEEAKPTHGGFRFFDQGLTAVLELPREVTIVLHSRRVGNTSLMQFGSLGIAPEEKRILILKGVNAPRGAYDSICKQFVFADTAGPTAADLSTFTYRYRRQPLFPFEPIESWQSVSTP